MTRESALTRLLAIVAEQENGGRDIEEHHEEADSILLRLIDDREITEAYQRIAKWYA